MRAVRADVPRGGDAENVIICKQAPGRLILSLTKDEAGTPLRPRPAGAPFVRRWPRAGAERRIEKCHHL